jgi:hypothetical protein
MVTAHSGYLHLILQYLTVFVNYMATGNGEVWGRRSSMVAICPTSSLDGRCRDWRVRRTGGVQPPVGIGAEDSASGARTTELRTVRLVGTHQDLRFDHPGRAVYR